MSTTTTTSAPKPGTKQSLLLNELEGGGATIADLAKVTGWQNHTVRAAMTGLRQRGFQIERADPADDAPAVYRLKTAATSRKRRSK